MNPQHPVYVLSKGRYDRCLTALELTRLEVPFKLVIEAQEVEKYRGKFPNADILVLPFSDMGTSTPARNFCWDHSIENGHSHHWVIDDNIEAFHRLCYNMKPRVTSGTIFYIAEQFVNRYENIAISGFNYYSFCKATDKVPPYVLNTKLYSCMLIDNTIPFRWEGKYNEDLHLCLRVLKAGYCTMQFNAFLAGKVTTQRMKGGNTDEFYKEEGTLKKSQFIVEQHPDVAKVVWKFNRWHHQVDYKRFKKTKLVKKNPEKKYPVVDNFGMKLVDGYSASYGARANV